MEAIQPLVRARSGYSGFGSLNPLEQQLFDYRDGIWSVSTTGVSPIETLMAPFATTPTAFATPSSNGDIVIVWYAGYLIPPPGSEPGPYSTLNELLLQYDKPGLVHLIETDIYQPTPKKRAVILTQNPVTVAQLAGSSSSTTLPKYAVGQGSNENVLAAARLIGPPKVQMAGIVVGGVALIAGAVLLSSMAGGKRRRS